MFALWGHNTFVSSTIRKKKSSFYLLIQTNNLKTEVVMKTLKFAMIAALVACTMMSLSYADGFTGKPKPIKSVNLTLEKAFTLPGLVWAMYEQIDKDDFLNNTQAILVAEVVYKGICYRISGTREQWIRFFLKHGDLPINSKHPEIGVN
jgi:hypothetical protein